MPVLSATEQLPRQELFGDDHFSTCPKHKPDCYVPGCGAVPFNKGVEGFTPHADLLASAAHAMLYRRGVGRLRSALDLPAPGHAEPDARSA